MPSTHRRRRGLLLIAITLVATVIIGAALWSIDEPAPPRITERTAQLDVLDGPHGRERVLIDATLYAPARTPAPAVLLAHGFGGAKESVAHQAKTLARRGFTVLTYSARGFGNSTGKIGLNAPEYEVTDARQIVDWLARQPEVRRSAEGDPVLGVTGDSYGGALSLLLAGTDHRVDAIAPVVTYNDLEQALLPNAATTGRIGGATPARGSNSSDGVFKRAWAGMLFSAGAAPPPPGTQPMTSQPSRPNAQPSGTVNEPAYCGNFTPEVCAAYTEIARTGKAGEATRELLARVSPKHVTARIKAPTLLVQGQQDTLFGLDQADANARQIARTGTPVRTMWYAGGHDGAPPPARVRDQIAKWFAFHLGGVGPAPNPGTGFVYDIAGERRRGGELPIRTISAPRYPGIRSAPATRFDIPLSGRAKIITNPPGASPSATSSLPSVRGSHRFTRSLATDWPGQVAVFSGEPAERGRVISGVPHTRLTVTSVPGEPGNGSAVLFAKLYDVSPEGRRSLLGNAVSPLRVTNLPPNGSAREVEVALPGVVHSLRQGHRLELAVSTTDQAHTMPTEPAVYRVGLGQGGALSVPSVPGQDANTAAVPTGPLVGIGLIGLVGLVSWLITLIRRRHSEDAVEELADTPVQLDGVGKSYSNGVRAVHDLSLRIERGQVVGLLGPNGAGKTTTLSMLLGLVRPTVGVLRVFGYRVVPGAPVLSRAGALVETPGFLPHLTGLENLRSYWDSRGLPMEQARLDEVLEIANLDPDKANRKVRTYTQGMRQRLAIAQAMLGMPELLLLDEPANRLDPSQIRQLREALRRYAATGRTVLLSSHLLSEVEQTCTHVVVLHEGAMVTSGTVDDLLATHRETTFEVDDPDRAADALYHLGGLGAVETSGTLVHAELGDHSPATAVRTLVASGIAVHRVTARQRLEDTFLRLVGEATP